MWWEKPSFFFGQSLSASALPALQLSLPLWNRTGDNRTGQRVSQLPGSSPWTKQVHPGRSPLNFLMLGVLINSSSSTRWGNACFVSALLPALAVMNSKAEQLLVGSIREQGSHCINRPFYFQKGVPDPWLVLKICKTEVMDLEVP